MHVSIAAPRNLWFQGLIIALGLLAAPVQAAEPLKIYTVNYPLQYFAQRITGSHADVVFPAPANEDPAYWQPSSNIIADYQKADLILLNGATYAKWLNKVSLPFSRQVFTANGFRDRFIKINEALVHAHGLGGEHAHTGVAFTTWLDFRLAIEHARAILKAVSRQRPELKATFEANFQALAKDLSELDETLVHLTAAGSPPLIGSHPVYQYLIKAYGLNMKSLHWEPDQMPADLQWDNLKTVLKEYPAGWMVWEGQPAPAIAARLKAMGVNSLVVSPAGNTPAEGDFLSVMRQNLENLKQVF